MLNNEAMSRPKFRWPTSLAIDVAIETVRSYLRMGTPIKAAIREAARDWHIGESTLGHYWYRRKPEKQGTT